MTTQTLNENSTTVQMDDEGTWAWVCGICREGGGGYDHSQYALAVAQAHQDIHELVCSVRSQRQ